MKLFLRVALGACLGLTSLCALAQAADPAVPQEPMREVRVATEAFSRGAALPAWVKPVSIPAATSDRPLVARLADTVFYVDARPSVFVHRGLQANNANALSQIGQYPIHFVPEYQTLRLHWLRLVRGDQMMDKTASANVRFLQRETGLEQGIYSGVVTASFLVDDVRVGDMLDIAYTIEGQNPVFGGKYVENATWDTGWPIELRRVSLIHSTSRPVKWKVIGDLRNDIPAPAESVQNGMRTLVWQEKSLSAFEWETYAPVGFTQDRWLQFSEFDSWAQVSDWAANLFRAGSQADAEIKKVADGIRTLPTPEEKTVAALVYAQEQIRYFSVSLGESSHRPAQPNVVLQRRYGDCKDKSFFLVALLRELGVDAQAVLVSLYGRRGLDKLLPTPVAFDHVIVRARVNGRDFYIDPTANAQRSKLDRIAQLHEGSQVLVVDGNGAALTEIVSPNPENLFTNNLTERLVIKKFDADGELEVTQIVNGFSAELLRVIFAQMTPEQKRKSAENNLERRYPGATLIESTVITDDLPNNILQMRTRYRVPQAVRKSQNDWVARFAPTNFGGMLAIPPSANRKSPLAVPGFPSRATYTFEVQWPEEVSAVRDPSIRKVDGKAFYYGVNTSFRGNQYKTVLDFRAKTRAIDAKDVAAFMSDLRGIDDIVRGVVIVAKEDIKGGSFLGIGKQDLKQTLLSRAQERVDKTSETIKGGKLSGTDLANALCDRAAAYSELGTLQEALADANEAVKLAPSTASAYQCRAEIHFATAEFQKSVTDYSKALSLGGTPAGIYYSRGRSRFYLGQLDEALADFQKGVSTSQDTGDAMYTELWELWTTKRLGKPFSENTLKRAGAQPRGDWPRPALAMLTGQLSPEEMLQQVNKKTGDDKELALTEAYFYLGQHYLSAGQAVRAKEYFEKARAQGVVMYIEHVAAKFELERLEKSR
jgi:lipoprotein NlpI/transglutaminase-like putative cysteine protease